MQNSQPMSGRDTKAALGIATALMEQHLKNQAPQPQETPQETPQTPSQPDDTAAELNGVKQQIISLKQEIEQALGQK